MLLLPDAIRVALENGAPLISSVSGGKDGHCMSLELARMRQVYGWPGRFVLIHADVGRMEWPQSHTHCRKLAEQLNAEFVIVKHNHRDLLEGIERRMKVRPDAPPFPSKPNRWCTSDFKRAVIDSWLKANIPAGTMAVDTIGYRREESTDRSKKSSHVVRIKTKGRTIYDWHPILEYKLADVWRTIGYTLGQLAEMQAVTSELLLQGYILDQCAEMLRFKAHPAYLAGNERVSCMFCILGSKNDLRNGMRFNRPLGEHLISIEDRSTFTFQQGFSLKELA